MITKDFDTEFASTGPAEFTLCGHKFHAKEHVPYTVWRTLMKGDERVTKEMSAEEVDRMLFADLLAPEDLDLFMETINSTDENSPKRAQVLAVYAWLMETASGSKAQPSAETSSDG